MGTMSRCFILAGDERFTLKSYLWILSLLHCKTIVSAPVASNTAACWNMSLQCNSSGIAVDVNFLHHSIEVSDDSTTLKRIICEKCRHLVRSGMS